MKITPTGNQPPHITSATSQFSGTGAQDLRAKAVAAFSDPAKVAAVKSALTGQPIPQPQAQTTLVANPNQISPEEIGALNVPKPQIMEQQTAPETSATEAATPEQQSEKPQRDPQLSKQFAQLARQTKLLRQQQQQLEQQKRDLETQKQTLTQQKPDLTNYISRDELKANTIQKLIEAGVSPDAIAQQMLNMGQTDPRVDATINALKAEINALKSDLTSAKEQAVKQQDESYKAALMQIKRDVVSLVKQDPTFETIRSTNSAQDVVDLIEETYKKDGYVMSVEEAAKEVEDYLVEEALKLTRIGKIKQRLAQAGQPKQEIKKTQAVQEQTQPTMKTLTNAGSISRPLSARERAIARFKGEAI